MEDISQKFMLHRFFYTELSGEQQELLEAASKAMGTAYNPYSNFFVGAALRTESGQIIVASNTENAAYGSTICAERNALGRGNAEGHRIYKAVAIIGRGETFDLKKAVSPCGSCRQMLNEAADVSGHDLEVIMSSTKMEDIVVSTIRNLLPLGFGPEALGIDLSRYREPRK